MIMKKISVFLLLMLSLNLFSQASIDSLETLLKIVSNREKVEILNELAKEYKSSLPEKTLEYSKQALELSQKIDYTKGEADALANIATAHYIYSDYHKSIEIFLEALQIYE